MSGLFLRSGNRDSRLLDAREEPCYAAMLGKLFRAAPSNATKEGGERAQHNLHAPPADIFDFAAKKRGGFDGTVAEYSVWLPHQCNEWLIAHGSHDHVLMELDRFIREARDARARLLDIAALDPRSDCTLIVQRGFHGIERAKGRAWCSECWEDL